MTPLTLVTSNSNKVAEAEAILQRPITSLSIELPEIQASTLEEITLAKLAAARSRADGLIVVEDVALGLLALGGFPGPYVRWLLESAGGEGLAALARGASSPIAVARCCLALHDGNAARVVIGETTGRILAEPRGREGFGWDSWFVPEGSERSYAEMTSDQKNRVSHRGRAWRALLAELEHLGI